MNRLLNRTSNLHRLLYAFALILLATINAKSQSITSISPTSGGIGTTITISGTGFNPFAANDVFFGPVKVTVNANASGNQIIVNVPAGASSYTTVIVRNIATDLQASSLSSSTPYFTITHSPALSITPASYNLSADLSGSSSQAIASGDFNNDGYADIVTGSGIVGGFASMLVYENNGLGDFPTTFPRLSLSGTSGAAFIKTGDLDGDGNLDIVAAKSVGGELDLFKGNGDGTFSSYPSISGVTGSAAGIALEDINNDGYIDLITTTSSNVNILIGDGNGNFIHATGSPKSLSPIANVRNVSTADFNNDGFIDLVIPSYNGGNSVLVLLNNQNDTFANALIYPTGDNPFNAISGDYDGDGNMDIAALSLASDNITILRGDGFGGFAPFPSSIPIPIPIGDSYGLEQGDFDGDGNLDLVVGGYSTNQVPLLQGDGAGGFTSFLSFPFPVGASRPFHIISGDFNNDGVADVPFANWGPRKFRILLSLSPQSFRTTWVTTDGQITIPTTGIGYNYDVVWSNLTSTGVGNGAITGVNGDYTITGLTNGDTYQVLIRGDFPRIYFNNGSEKDKIITVEEWGNNPWSSMERAFYGCTNLTIPATDAPDLALVADMSRMFLNASSFNSDISGWDISKVSSFQAMFQEASSYNNGGVILDWANLGQDASVITITMDRMFASAAAFNQDISGWNISKVQSFRHMFNNATSFNNGGVPLNWTTMGQDPNVTNIELDAMFVSTSSFNHDISDWDVSKVSSFHSMFRETSSYNNGGVILDWANLGQDASVITIAMGRMFESAAAFNQDISGWDVSKVSSLNAMFKSNSSFNNGGVPLDWMNLGQDPNVTDIRLNAMFQGAAAFNHDISDWDVSKVFSFYAMFASNSSFNNGGVPLDWMNLGQDAGVNTVDMGYMFSNANAFNQDISTWSVNKVWNLRHMFLYNNSFNNGGIPLDWINLGQSANVTGINMQEMFNGASAFDQEIGSWDIGKANSMANMLSNSGLSTANYDATLIGWADDNSGTETIPSGRTLGATGLTYCTGLSARTDLVSTYGWAITDAGAFCPEINVFNGSTNAAPALTDAQTVDVDFGSAAQASNITRTFIIENTGTSDLTIDSITASGGNFTVSSAIATVAIGAIETFTVTLLGTNTGTFNSIITIVSNDADKNPFTFPLIGQINGINVINGEDDNGEIIISNQEVNIGSTVVNTDLDKIFVIENLSASNNLIINSITSDNPVFVVINPPSTIAPSDFIQFTVRLIADAVGIHQGTLSVSTNLNDFTFVIVGEVREGDLSTITVFNVVTPNGDGVHDFLKITNIENFSNNQVMIYNRWGDMVFVANGYDNQSIVFNGKASEGNSNELDTGNYYYTILKGNGEEALTGFIFLKR
ncbi:MAG: BspA family leucine-rich repeat surface protein [Cyclobacteriaceae bacterium]|nr:BspA family leucine-rich repeat surface protein [Cyclobacteriaceae bacterium]